jgi:hypothetical protein
MVYGTVQFYAPSLTPTSFNLLLAAPFTSVDPFGSNQDRDIYTVTNSNPTAYSDAPVYINANSNDGSFFVTGSTGQVKRYLPDGTMYMPIDVSSGDFLIPFLGPYWDETNPSLVYQFRAYRITPTKFVWQRGNTPSFSATPSRDYPFVFSDSGRSGGPELLAVVNNIQLTPDLTEPPVIFELEPVNPNAGSDVRVKDGFGNYLARYTDPNSNYIFLGFFPSQGANSRAPAVFNCVYCTPTAGGGAAVCQLQTAQQVSVDLSGAAQQSASSPSSIMLTASQRTSIALHLRADENGGALADNGTRDISGTLTALAGTISVDNPPNNSVNVIQRGPNRFIRIDGQTGRRLRTPSGFASTNGYSLIFVINNMRPKSDNTQMIFASQWRQGALHLLYEQNSSRLIIAANDADPVDIFVGNAMGPQGQGQPYVLTVTVTPDGIYQVYVNRTPLSVPGRSRNRSPDFNTPLHFGADDNASPGRTMLGEFGEFMMFTRVLDTTAVNDLYANYFKLRYTSLP